MTVHRLALLLGVFVVFGSCATAAPWPEASGTTDQMPVVRGADETTTIRHEARKAKVALRIMNPTSVMAEPVPTSPVVSQLGVNAAVYLIEERGAWLRVSTPTGLGWIQRRQVDLSRHPATATTQRVVLREPATIFHAPNLAARSVEALPMQASMTLVEDRGDWLRVRTVMNIEGWLQRSSIVPSPSGAALPPP